MKTAIAWLILYISGLTSSFIIGPIMALLTYMFTFYTQFSWARTMKYLGLGMHRWSLYAGIVLFISYLLMRKNRKKMAYSKMPQLKWLILIIINMLILTPFAAWPKENDEIVVQFIKLIVLYFLIIKIVNTKLYYRIFIWLQIWGNWLFGWQATWGTHTIGGRLEKIGSPGVKESNQLAAHMLSILPFMGNRFIFGKKLEKIYVICATPFIVNAIILCRSRGAFIALLIMAGLWILFTRKGVRIRMATGIIVGSLLFVYLTDPGFWDRIMTISEYQEEGAARARIETWKGSIEMIKDHPFGSGGGGWDINSPVYIPEIVQSYGGELRAVHNTYLQMATDWGVQGLFFFLVFLGSTIVELHRIRKRTGLLDDKFYHTESIALEISLIGFLVAAIFINRVYAESLYWFCALAAALSNIQQSTLIETANGKQKE